MEKQQTINGRQFSFGIIPPIEAIEVEVAIAKVIGEPLFKAFTERKNGSGTEDMSDEEFAATGAAVIGLLTSKMDAKELIKTMQTVFQYVSCDGKHVNINETFVGRNREIWIVFFNALRFNFKDFLPESLFASLKKIVQK